jgi:hypothetical protein
MEQDMTEQDEENKKRFLEKRKEAYKNEFAMAKALQEKEEEDDENKVDETMKNTLINKFSGKK